MEYVYAVVEILKTASLALIMLWMAVMGLWTITR
jgi:hypothetical protein